MKLTKEQVILILSDMLDSLKSGDSMEGRISYMLDYEAEEIAYDTNFAYRVGNLEGQGGWRMSND